MKEEDVPLAVIRALQGARIPYMIVGSLSSNFYSFPRSTQDADLVLDLSPGDLDQLTTGLPGDLILDEQPSFETVTGTFREILRMKGSAFVVELFQLSKDPHDQERFQRRVEVSFQGTTAWLPTPEDVVVTKLRWCVGGKRSKDYDDVRNVVAVQGNALNFDYIRSWCDRHETRDVFEEIYASVKEFFE